MYQPHLRQDGRQDLESCWTVWQLAVCLRLWRKQAGQSRLHVADGLGFVVGWVLEISEEEEEEDMVLSLWVWQAIVNSATQTST